METRESEIGFTMRKLLELFPLIIIFVAAGMRILPHEPNFAPIGALALFGGANFKSWKAFAVPIAAMIISDLFLGFHSTMIWVYGSFILITLLGKVFLSGKVKWGKLLGLSLLSSVLFYLITNFGVWATGTMYARIFSGLIESYAMGVPFFRNTILGDLTYNFVFFGAYALALKTVGRYNFSE